MSLKKQVEKANELLVRELGSSSTGMPNYMWRYSEDWKRPMRVIDVIEGKEKPRYEYIENPETKLFQPIPVYVDRKVCQELHHQWVMSIWLSTGTFAQWREHYQDNLEWPKGGEYFPVNAINASTPGRLVCLQPGTEPTIDDTWKFIHIVKQTRVELQRFENAMAMAALSKQKSEKDFLMGELLNKLPAFVPDAPVWAGVGHNVDTRVSASDKKNILGEA